MDILNFIERFFTDPHFTNYIIAAQIPTVACLGIMCFIAYKFGFKEFKLIAYAWGINLSYLAVSIIVTNLGFNDSMKLALATLFDLTSTCIFFKAVKNTYVTKSFSVIKRVTNKKNGFSWIVILAILAGVIKLIPGDFQVVPYIHLRYLPAAIFNFVVLFFVSKFFKEYETKYVHNNYLSTITFIYALLQILTIGQNDKHESNIIILSIDNIGFAAGLLLKMTMLVLLSRLLVYAVNNVSSSEKEALLKRSIQKTESLLTDFSKASNRILVINRNDLGESFTERQTGILELTFNKILSLLNKDLGIFSVYKEKNNNLEILFASERYKKLIGYQYSAEFGITGASLKTGTVRLVNSVNNDTEYKEVAGIEQLGIKINSAISIPVILDKKALGVFLIECEKENCFTELDISIVESLIYQATAAIKNNALIKDLENSKIFLDCLKEIDRRMVDNYLHLEPVLNFILTKALELVNCDSGNIDIVNDSRLICIASTNKKNYNAESLIDSCLSGRAVIEQRYKYFPNLESLDDVEKSLYIDRLGKGFKCELVVPLIVKEKVIGVFNAESKEINKFSREDIDKIEGFAGQTAIAIYITKLIEDINEKNKVLENSIDKRNIEMTFLLGNIINHRIGNSIGTVRTKIKDRLLASQENDMGVARYGMMNDELIKELKVILSCAEKALDARKEISEKVSELLTLKPTPIDFVDFKTRIENLDEVRVSENVSFKIENFDILKPVYVSPILFMEVISELISNGIKAIYPNTGTVLISGSIEDRFNIITIQDNGCGIDERDILSIFKKGISKWENNRQGGGIGLFEVKRIVEFWGGTIDVNSKANYGTTFIVKLPFDLKRK